MLTIKQNILFHFTCALSSHAEPGYKAVLILISFLDITHFIKVQQSRTENIKCFFEMCGVYISDFFAIQFSSDDCF